MYIGMHWYTTSVENMSSIHRRAAVCLFATVASASTWETQTVLRSNEYVRAFSYPDTATYAPSPAGNSAGAAGCDEGGCVTYSTGTLQSGSVNPCDCAGKTVAWKQTVLSTKDFNRLAGTPDGGGASNDDSVDDDDAAGAAGGPPPTSRCESVSMGWGFDVSPEDTAGVLTIPPGSTRAVWLGGDSTPGGSSATYLGTDATARGMPCGTVFQDVYEGIPVRSHFHWGRRVPFLSLHLFILLYPSFSKR
jgi:hypothetical protein